MKASGVAIISTIRGANADASSPYGRSATTGVVLSTRAIQASILCGDAEVERAITIYARHGLVVVLIC